MLQSILKICLRLVTDGYALANFCALQVSSIHVAKRLISVNRAGRDQTIINKAIFSDKFVLKRSVITFSIPYSKNVFFFGLSAQSPNFGNR